MYGLKIAILGALAASVPALAQDDVASQLPQCGVSDTGIVPSTLPGDS